MGSALCGMLPVDKWIIDLTVLVAMRHGQLHVLLLKVDDGIKPVSVHIFLQQVHQPVFGNKGIPVKGYGKPRIQVHVIPDHRLHVVFHEPEMTKHLRVGDKGDQGTVFFFGRLFGFIKEEIPLAETDLLHAPVAE